MSKVIESEVKSLFSAPTFDRRAFVVTSLGAGFALAVLPVSAQTITTPADGLVAGEVKIPVAGGEMVAYRAMPATGGNFPVILVVSEIWGAHEHIRDVARRFAKLGYFAVAPELFARQGDAKAMADVQALIRDIVAKTPDAQVMADLDAVVAYAKATGKVDGTSIGVTGFCWGGRIALMYAAHNPELDAAVAWYGPTARSYFPGDRTPLDVVAQTKVPVLGPLRRRRRRHPERVGREVLRGAEDGRQREIRVRDLSGDAARVPRRLPADLPQGQGRGRLEARGRVVQAAPGLTFARAAQPGRAACGSPVAVTRAGRGGVPLAPDKIAPMPRAGDAVPLSFPVPGPPFDGP